MNVLRLTPSQLVSEASERIVAAAVGVEDASAVDGLGATLEEWALLAGIGCPPSQTIAPRFTEPLEVPVGEPLEVALVALGRLVTTGRFDVVPADGVRPRRWRRKARFPGPKRLRIGGRR